MESPKLTILQSVLSRAQKDLWKHFEGAADFKHHGLRGDEREEAIRRFLKERLPNTYKVATGEVVDISDYHSTQLDAIIYDGARNRALVDEATNAILPAEALLAVISVKSRLTRSELGICYEAAKNLYQLRPFEKQFLSPKTNAAPSTPRECRVFLSVFSYESDLNAEDWLNKEWARIEGVAGEVGCDVELINRVLVLGRGLIMNNRQMGKASSLAGGADVLHEWFLHLVNFLGRENGRRSPVDWNLYSRRSIRKWTKLTV